MIKESKNIVFIGMPGCGKTTIGNRISKGLNMEFYDIDEYIKEKEGKSIQEIFKDGEEYFRKIESEAVKEVSKKTPIVISTGGGVVKSHRNMEYLKKNGIIIFINRPLENIVADIDINDRPLLKEGREKLIKLYKERYDLYKKYCDYEILNNSELSIVIDRILKLIERLDIM